MLYSLLQHHSATATICVSLTLANTASHAQEDWQLQTGISLATGRYTNSSLLKNQITKGIRADLQSSTQGAAFGYQNTYINFQEAIKQPQQIQESWMLSTYISQVSPELQGQITYKIDTHHVSDKSAKQADIFILAPQVSWTSYEHPLSLSISTAHSKYQNMSTIRQYGAAIGLGFNNHQDWIELREYLIANLPPEKAEHRTHTIGKEIRLTHITNEISSWCPSRITLAIEFGEKIYYVDMTTQSVFNIPILNRGGQSITAMWQLNTRINFTTQLNQNRYSSSLNGSHNNTRLTTASIQTAYAW